MMKRQTVRKIFLALLIGILVLVSACACSKTELEKPDDSTQETQGTAETAPYTEMYLIRPEQSSESLAELCSKLKTVLSEKTDMKISIKNDYSFTYEAVEGRGYLYLGATNGTLSQKAAAQAKEGHVVYLHEGDSIAVYAADDSLMWGGVQKLLADCLKDGALQIGAPYAEKDLDLSDCYEASWQQPFPAYTDGTLDATLYSCGYGTSEGKDPTEMQIVQDTTMDAFYAYVERLESLGYTLSFNNYIDGNAYAALTDQLGSLIYVYYLTEDGQGGTVRAIYDRSSVSLEEFCYTTAGSDNTEFYMFNMNTSSEDTFLIHAADNSWIFLDGGVTNYAGTDPEKKFADALFDFMWERSDLKEGEKLVISCWYLSHAHRDHFLAFDALIQKYHDRIELQRMLANVPDSKVADHNSNMNEFLSCMKTVNTYYPDLLYLKAHTGMEIQIADVSFTVLFTQEDMVDFWVANRDDYYAHWQYWSSTSKSDPNYQTYRDGYKLYDYNNSSLNTVISVNGMSVLELGDGYRCHEWMAPYYSLSTLRTDVLKIAHHFYNEETLTLYEQITANGDPVYVLINHTSYTTSTQKLTWVKSLSAQKGQYVITASGSVIYGLKKVNGKVVKEEIPATYSWMLT